jgi:hypothetical protein
MRLPYRILIALAGSAVLLYAACESGTRGLADWNGMRWRHEIDGWSERRTTPAQERMQEAITTLIDVRELTPDDPALIEHMGVFHNLRGSGYPAGSDSWRLNLAQALAYFREAAALRPTSSYNWANIASAKYRLGQPDGEFFAAMRHALDFGPWEPSVQLILADTGLGAWDRLDGGLREKVSENLQRTAVRQADALARIATYHRRIDVVCAASLDIMKNKVKCPK